jgi:hypothetical protein
MYDCAILDVGALSNPYVVNVPSDHTVEPHAGMLTNVNVSNDLRAGLDECRIGNPGFMAFIRQDH